MTSFFNEAWNQVSDDLNDPVVYLYFSYPPLLHVFHENTAPEILKQHCFLSFEKSSMSVIIHLITLEIVFTRAAPPFDNLFMGCVFNINTVHKTVEKLTFQAFY